MQIRECKVNHIKNPMGYKMGKPTFSWIVDGLEAVESRIILWEQKKSSACEELCCAVAETEAADNFAAEAVAAETIVADTGWAKLSPLATSVAVFLKPRTRYLWRVQARDAVGRLLESEKQFFETGKLEEPWAAQWITCGNEEKRLPIFQKEFAVSEKKEMVRARLYICGLGLFEAYIGGCKVGEEYLAPGCHTYNHYVQARTYDVTELVRAEADRECGELNDIGQGDVDGGNADRELRRISVLLGDGWYKGRFDFEKFSPPVYGEEFALIAELHITYGDGMEEVIGTDDTWTVRRSNITFSGIYDGEIVDGTLPELPEEKAALLKKEMPPIEDRLSIPVTAHERFAPTVLHTPKGELVLDIGQNLAGIFELKVREKRGQRIHLQFGEVLQDGSFYRDNLRTARAEYIYISDGEPGVLRPHFTYYGYRYVKVEGITDLQPEDFTALAIYSDVALAGKVVTGNALVNQLISNTVWGMKSNFVDIPTDCPQRDERMGWTGDTQAFSETACFLADTYAFYRKYLYDMSREQKARGGLVPDVVPAFRMSRGCSVWGDATCIIPWNMYLYTGDASALKEHYDSMVAWLAYIGEVDGDNHGWRNRFHYGDWLALDSLSQGVAQTRGGTDEGFIADVYYRKSAIILSKAAAVLGRDEDVKYYSALADKILQGIREEYYSQTGRCCIRTQTAALLTLQEGLSDSTRAKAVLKELLEESGNKPTTGFVGTPLLCPTLTEQGMAEEAFRLLLNEEYPGWLYAVKLGATTIWERWNSLDETGHISSTGMNSLNHYTYGSIIGWIWKDVVGLHVREDAPGFQKVDIRPQVNWKLKYLEAEYPSAAGTYEIKWEILDINHIYMKIVVPNGCQAVIELPLSGKGMSAVDAGTYEFTYETTSPIAHVYTIDEKLKLLMAEPMIRDALREEIKEVDYLVGYTGEYPLRETLTNLGYSAEFMERLDERLKVMN